MPFIRVTCSKGSLTSEQKAKLAPMLVEALVSQETDPVVEIGRANTGMFFDEIDVANSFPGGRPLKDRADEPYWLVEAVVAASFFGQKERDMLQTLVAKAFVDVLGDDDTVLQREDIRISPAYLMRVHCVLIEIPEGSWGAGGQTIDTEKIAVLMGGTKGPKRLAEVREIAARMKAARLS